MRVITIFFKERYLHEEIRKRLAIKVYLNLATTRFVNILNFYGK